MNYNFEKQGYEPKDGTKVDIVPMPIETTVSQTIAKPNVSGWVSVHDALPETLETVWISNGKGWTTLGCRSDFHEGDDGKLGWCWCVVANGIIYEEDGKIVAECEEDDLDVCFWHPLPIPPCR